MTAQDTAALVVAATTVIGSFIGSVRWLVKHYLNELKPADFVHFKMLANEIRLWFLYNISGGIVFVEADSIILESLGY